MLDEKVLESLLLYIDEINALALQYGFKEVTVFNPIRQEDKKALHFFADCFDNSLDLFKLNALESNLSLLLNCPIKFTPKEAISLDFEKIVMKDCNNVKLIKNNEEKIRELFDTLLVKKSEQNKTNKYAGKLSFYNAAQVSLPLKGEGENLPIEGKNLEDAAIELVESALSSNKAILEYVNDHLEIFDKIKNKHLNASTIVKKSS